jgi:hypothetical protein
MSILDTLLTTGTLSDEGGQLLYDTVAKVGRSNNFPPPTGFRVWNEQAVIAAAHDFLTGTRAVERLVHLAAQAADDATFTRLLETAILNFLRDEARRTVLGRQIRRLKDVIDDLDDVSIDGDYVFATHASREPFSGDEAGLVQAARSVSVTQRRWRPESKREGPLAAREDMIALVRAVLDAARGGVTLATLGRVVARRFDLDSLPVTVSIDALDPPSLAPYAEVEVADQVAVILDQLTVREREILPLLDLSSREAARYVDLGHSTIAKTQASLRSLLQELIPPGDSGSAMLRVLTERLAAEQRH